MKYLAILLGLMLIMSACSTDTATDNPNTGETDGGSQTQTPTVTDDQVANPDDISENDILDELADY